MVRARSYTMKHEELRLAELRRCYFKEKYILPGDQHARVDKK